MGQSSLLRFFLFGLIYFIVAAAVASAEVTVDSDILFITQVPFSAVSNNLLSASGNHRASVTAAPRGGDLYIRYQDGTLKNLTAAAGYGEEGLQGTNAIAVRDPCVHWDGSKVIFSMVVGSPELGVTTSYVWQLYELTGLGKNDTPSISKVSAQPSDYNNIMPAYGSDDQIFFVSDRPRDGSKHLHPQLDEALSFSTNTGLWKLNTLTSQLLLIDHAPSGAFKPIVDTFGRVLMTRWDHLQRDQLGDDTDSSGAFNYSNESLDSPRLYSKKEIFPEPRSPQQKLSNLNLHNFNQFFPWQVNQDGSELETLNHIGRHELRSRFLKSFTSDSNLKDFEVVPSMVNQNRIVNLFQLHEDNSNPGLLYGVDAPQFDSHGAGQLVSLFAPPSKTADQISVNYLTHRETHDITETPSPFHSGLYRDPLVIKNGLLLASHATYTATDRNDGTRANPQSHYNFQIKVIEKDGDFWNAKNAVIPPIVKAVSYYDPSELVSFFGPLWQLQPVEVKVRSRPPLTQEQIFSPETQAFSQAGVDITTFKSYLLNNNLALIIGRNVTTRDIADLQQPFNLRVAGGTAQTIGSSGKIYDVSHLKILQGDLLRGYGGSENPLSGRRIIAQPLHDDSVYNPPSAAGPPGSVKISDDGSFAALVPATRALSWELTNPKRQSVVRERYWLTFKAGEIRVCTSCHGLNSSDQANRPFPQNSPEALKYLLNYWKTHQPRQPKYKLKFLSARNPNIKKTIFYPQDEGLINIAGLTDSAASKALDIFLKVGRNYCSSPVAHLVTGSDGKVTLRGKLPKLESAKLPAVVPISFELRSETRLMSRAALRLRTVRGKTSISKISNRQLQAICNLFENFK